MSQLFSEYRLGPLTLPNRLVISPMCQYSADHGKATDWHVMHLGNLAMSGAGCVIVEATAVSPEGRITPGCLGLWDDQTQRALARPLEFVRQHSDSKILIQLAHAGRKASSAVPWKGGQQLGLDAGGWQTVSASHIPFNTADRAPVALDKEGIQKLVQDFQASARRAVELGLDGIEIHAAHGYLLHQFLSPLSNQRNDEYGGSLQNRIRIVLEVFDAVRAVTPSNITVGIRISATDWVDGGWSLDQSLELCTHLKARGCDFVDVSSGGLSTQQSIPVGPGYQVGMASEIRRTTKMTTMAVGMITSAYQAEQILASGQADLIAIARAVMYDARWGWHAAAELGDQVNAPPQYWRATPAGQPNPFKR